MQQTPQFSGNPCVDPRTAPFCSIHSFIEQPEYCPCALFMPFAVGTCVLPTCLVLAPSV